MGQFHQPIGLAHRETFDLELGWGRGIIWIAPPGKYFLNGEWRDLDWKKSELLSPLLLHEMGHLFGAGHIEGTVMDPQFAEQILEESDCRVSAEERGCKPTRIQDSIDQKRVLMLPVSARLELPGRGLKNLSDEEKNRVFRSLFAKEITGDVVSKFTLNPANWMARVEFFRDQNQQESVGWVQFDLGQSDKQITDGRSGTKSGVCFTSKDDLLPSFNRHCYPDSISSVVVIGVTSSGMIVNGVLNFNIEKFLTMNVFFEDKPIRFFEGLGMNLIRRPLP